MTYTNTFPVQVDVYNTWNIGILVVVRGGGTLPYYNSLFVMYKCPNVNLIKKICIKVLRDKSKQ